MLTAALLLADALQVITVADVKWMQWGQFGVAVALFLATLLYFPATPPTPSSRSAAIDCSDRFDYRGQWRLLLNFSFWLITVVSSISSGLMAAWGSLLDVNMTPLGFTQEQARGGRVGACSCAFRF